MALNRLTTWWLLGAGVSLLLSCEQSGEALDDRKRRENDAAITEYLTTNNIPAQPLPEALGMYLARTRANPNGQVPQVGDEVQYHYVARRLDNQIVDSTQQRANQPGVVVLLERNAAFSITPGGLYEGAGLYLGLRQLREGEEATLLVPYYLNSGRPGTLLLPDYSPIRYDVRSVAVRTEDEQIEEYIRANNLTVTQKTDDGIRIIVTQARPDSALIQTGQTVTASRVKRMLNGVSFDASAANTEFRVGEERVERGWDRAMTRLRRGEKAILIFPSSLGYGADGRRGNNALVVPPYRPLRFDIEVVRVR